METKILTIMFTDIKGFTAKTSDSSRDEMAKMMAEHERLLTPAFRYFNGRVVKTIGDAFLVVFESPTDAVLCGMAIQEVLRKHNLTARAEERIEVRVAINLGEVELKDGDVLGEPVNIAARLEGIADAGEVAFTEAVCLAMNRSEIPSTEIGERTFKGIPYPVRVYRVAADANSEQLRRLRDGVRVTKDEVVLEGLRPRGNRALSKPVAAVAAGAAFVLLGVFAVLLMFHSRKSSAVRQADALAAKGEWASALYVVDQTLQRDPLDSEFRDKAIDFSGHYVDSLAADKPEEAQQWLEQQLKEKPYLEPLRKRLPELEARVLATKMVRGEIHESIGWDQVREMVWKNKTDPEVPYQMARILEKRFIPEALIWLYEKSFELGAHRDDLHPWELCEKIFGRDMPEETRGAHEFAAKYYPTQMAAWPKATIEKGSGFDLINAWYELDSNHDPLAAAASTKSRVRAAIKELLKNKDLWDSTKQKLRALEKKLS